MTVRRLAKPSTSLAEQIAREHVSWLLQRRGWPVWRIILEHGQAPLPVGRAPTEEDAVKAIAQAWITLICDIVEAA
jgi:hypothetical protein